MDNYLNHRWPQGPGAQPVPVPAASGQPPKSGKKRSPRRWLVPLVSIILVVALLGGVCFWAVNGIAGMLAQLEPSQPDAAQPQPSQRLDSSSSQWSADDLPWGNPDPSVTLSVRSTGSDVTAQQAYQGILPSLVSVEAVHADRYEGVSLGTGIVVTRSGYVVTNYHIIDETVSIRVQLIVGDGRYFNAKVIGFDEEFDLAVLKFEPGDAALTPAVLGDSDRLAVGDPVYAVGNPMGYLTGSMSTGIVSALDRESDWDDSQSKGSLGLIQTDAAINPGSSGGALLDQSGQVVGITSAKITGLSREGNEALEDSVVLEGMGLAIPISDALPFINHILATGESWRPAMGIRCSAAQVDGRRGIQVAAFTAAAPREAGLREDDLILTANGVSVTTLTQLRRVLYRTGAGEELTCTVLRGGEEYTVSFPLIDSLKEE